MRLIDRHNTAIRQHHRGVVPRVLDGLMRLAVQPSEGMVDRRRPGCMELHEAVLTAIRSRNTERVHQLLSSEAAQSAGLGPQTPLGSAAVMPLTAAVQSGSLDCVNLLVEGFGASVSMPTFGACQSFSLVMLAIQRGDEPMGLRLLELGANPNETGASQKTPLMSAIEQNLQGLAIALIAKGADAQARSSAEETPLHLAASRSCGQVTRALIAAGVDLNAKNLWGETALHYAVEGRSFGCIRSLMVAGADWRIPSKVACTPLVKAIQAGDAEMASVLIETGADLGHEVNGVSAMTMASRSPVPEIAALGQALSTKMTLQRIAQLAKAGEADG